MSSEIKELPKVSVMVVTYNHANFIRETLDSILKDDYDNIEVVVADDASTDGTQDILKEYFYKYPNKIKLILNAQNLGITNNCNKAFFACTGDLIALFAGDDLFLPGKLRAQVAVFIKNPEVVLCYHSAEVFMSDTGKVVYVTYTNPKEDLKDVQKLIQNGGIFASSCVMVRRSACPPDGYDVRLPTVSDWLFLLETSLNGQIAKVDGIYTKYRKHQKSTTNNLLPLLDESIYTLDLLMEKHPERKDLLESCKMGKARYIAGEGFRQLSRDINIAYELSQRALFFCPERLVYKIFSGLCFILKKNQILYRTMQPLIVRYKYFLRNRIL